MFELLGDESVRLCFDSLTVGYKWSSGFVLLFGFRAYGLAGSLEFRTGIHTSLGMRPLDLSLGAFRSVIENLDLIIFICMQTCTWPLPCLPAFLPATLPHILSPQKIALPDRTSSPNEVGEIISVGTGISVGDALGVIVVAGVDSGYTDRRLHDWP